MLRFDAIVAGAGIWGCTIAYRLAKVGKRVLVLEKRNVIGGNCRCDIDEETGIEIHKYGSHIFHTHIPKVWEFVNHFTKFNGYQHKVLANYQGKTYFLPIGLAMINKYFQIELTPQEVHDFMNDKRHSTELFNAFFRGYTSKQWGCPPEEIDPLIIKRVPVRENYDVNYFNDYWQGIPSDGYNALFANLLNNPNIVVVCNTVFKFDLIDGNWTFTNNEIIFNYHFVDDCPVYYSGPIDELFGFKYGYLPWRSLRFETEKLNIADFQGTSVVNYTSANIPFTRIHEFKHFHPEKTSIMKLPKTIIMREYPSNWQPGEETYYPVDNTSSREILAKYQFEASRVPGLVVGGRLGSYKYYDMDQSIAEALEVNL